MLFLSRIGSKIGVTLEMEISQTNYLLEAIQLPTFERSKLEHKLEYLGLPNQCFDFIHMGHIGKECSQRIHKPVSKVEPHLGNSRNGQQWVQVDKKGEKAISQPQGLPGDVPIQNSFEILQGQDDSLILAIIPCTKDELTNRRF